MFEVFAASRSRRVFTSLDLLGAHYSDDVNDGLRGNTPSCDGMGPQNNRHVGDGRFCREENYLSLKEREATLGV